MDTGGSFGLPPQSNLVLVYSDLLGTHVCIGGEKNNSLTQGLVDFAAPAARWGRCVHDGGPSLLGIEGAVPSSKSDHPWSFLSVSSL
jgi:hypothetical protein